MKSRRKKYSTGGNIVKGVGAGAYGIGEGLVDNLTFGLTDQITNKGYQALNNLNKDSQSQKISNYVRSGGNIVGQIGGAIGTGGATTTTAISGGLRSANDIMQNTNMNDRAKQYIGAGTNLAAMGIGFAGGGMNGKITDAPQSLQGILNTSSKMKNIQFRNGGTLPINPGDLDKVTGNTLQYDGNAHSNGGIPLQNGAELEKNETVIKPGAIGNENPYALSPNIVITEEAAKMFGLSKSDIGKSIADVSRTVEARKPKSQEKMAVKTNEMNKKFALDKLMKANEYLASQMGDSEQNGEKKPYGGELPLLPRTVGSIYQTRNPLEYVQPNYANLATVRSSDSVPEMDLYAKPQIPNANFWGTGKEMNINPINTRSQTINPATNYNPIVANQTATSPLTTAGRSDERGGESTPLSSFNLGLGLKGAALLGELATIGGKPKNIPAQYNPYKSQIIDNANLRIDNSAIKNDIASSLNTALNSSSGRSWASQRALNAQMMGNASDAQSKANLQSQEANNRYKEQLSQTYNNLGQQDVAARNMAEVLNAQTQAAWKQGIRAGIGNIGNQGADALIKHQYVQDARKDGANLNMMQAKLLVDKWKGTFAGVDDELVNLVLQAYPTQFKTREDVIKHLSEATKK